MAKQSFSSAAISNRPASTGRLELVDIVCHSVMFCEVHTRAMAFHAK
jgi:hypothetical protein